jgi:hypothetical protein
VGWLSVRLVRYLLAYPEYAGIVRYARDTDRPYRARAALMAWRRAALRRTGGTLLVTFGGWLALRWLHTTHGTPPSPWWPG